MLQALIISVSVLIVFCDDRIYIDGVNSRWNPYYSEQTSVLTTTSPRFIDIYTNHHSLQDVLTNYRSIAKRPNNRYFMPAVPSMAADRKDPGYYDNNAKQNNQLESEFGVIVDEKQQPSTNNFVYVETPTFTSTSSSENVIVSDKFNYNRERRPRFKTQKNNWTSTQNYQLTRFSYVQKIPKLQSSMGDQNKVDGTKGKINDMLKKYLGKLYAQKYYHQNNKKPDAEKIDVEETDENLKSKFFDESLWNLKNKTKIFANKLFSLFTVIQFANSKCTTSSSSGQYEGTCYTQQECTNLNGTAMGNCANGYGVCCVFKGTCGGSARQNCSYFESPGYPNYYPSDNGVIVPTTQNPSPTPDPRLKYNIYTDNQWARQSGNQLSCTFDVYKLNNNIQQMRIDFIDLELRSPTNGTCVDERLVISGQNVNDQVPLICGYNTGQHVYVDVSMLSGPLHLSILSSVVANKRFKIRVCQLTTSCTNSNNCLQYYMGVTGVISSFNYDQAAMFSRSTPGYFNNLNYAICIRKEAGYCSITYTNVVNGMEYPFQFRNVGDNGANIIPPGQAGADIFNCPDDYIIIGGTRLCGYKFNDGSVNEDFTMNAPVTDSSAGPIIVPVRTDRNVTGQGFKLFYTQNRCAST